MSQRPLKTTADKVLFYAGALALGMPLFCFTLFFAHLFWSSQNFFFGLWNFVEPATMREFFLSVVRTLQAVSIAIIVALPLSLCTALFLEEFGPKTLFHRLINSQIIFLTRIPSITFGLASIILFGFILGLSINTFFIGLVLSCMALPAVTTKAQLAFRDVPFSYREASFALGASRWSVIQNIVLPAAFRDIVSGSSFSFARTVGEAAPLVIIYQLAVAGKNNLAIAGAAESAKTIPVLIYEWTIKHLEMEQHIISSGGSYTVSSLQNTELFSSLSAAILVIFAIQGSLHLFGYWAARTSPTAP